MPQYVLSEADKNALARLLSKTGSAPPRPAAFATPIRAAKGPDAMWALPPCRLGIPVGSGMWVDTGNTGSDSPTNQLSRWELSRPGEAVCCLWHDKGNGLEPMYDPMGNPIRQVVYNYGQEPVFGLAQIYRHRDGKWVAEQPETQAVTTTQNPASTSTTQAPSPCTGDCIFTANSSLEWTGPTGGCANTTTTTSTTTTSTTSTTTTSSTTTTTPSPAACVGKECRLVCVDTGTTPAPVDGIPPPYVKFKYELLTGYECDGDCGCYGLGDPCFLEDGEIVSQCLQGTTTTTLPPTVYTPCELAEILMGAPAPGESRFAALPGKPETWEICQACEFGSFLQYGTLEKMEETIYNDIVLVAKQTCLKDPCQDMVAGPLATRNNSSYYVAYTYAEQVAGAVPESMREVYTHKAAWEARLDGIGEPFSAYENKLIYKRYWKKCLGCPQKGWRDGPEWEPTDWAYIDPLESGLAAQDETSEDYDPDYLIRNYEKTTEISRPCVPGPDCSFCSEFPVPPTTTPDPSITTTTLTPTTTSTTTTLAPCSCPQPQFCPTVTGQCTKTVCQRGGDALPAPICGSTTTPAPNTCFDGLKWRTCPDCGYVGNSTTTTGTTTTGAPCSKPTVNLICARGIGWEPEGADDLCCAGESLGGDFDLGKYPLGVDPFTRQCGYRDTGVNYLVDCGTVVSFPCVAAPTTTTTLPPPPKQCAGGECRFQAGVQAGGTYGAGPYVWELYYMNCQCSDGQVSGEQTGAVICCECLPPATPPTAICDLANTSCAQPTGYQPCCCSTAEACNKSCTWNSPGGSTWTKIIDPCAPSCPCPAPSRVPSSTCDTYTVRCNDGSTTTTTSTTTTSTTTTAPTGACCQLGSCYNTSSSQCTGGGGVWLGAGSTCDSCQGACCQIGTGACSQSFEAGCPSSGGFIFGGIGSTCAGSPCLATTVAPTTTTTSTTTTTTSTTTTTAAPTGACCGTVGCFQVSSAVCTEMGGTYQGDGTSCALGDCNGACCFPGGACGESSYAFCAGYYGTFGGYGTDCSPNPCPTTTGAPTTTVPPTAPPPP